ncbi:hypothetical protein D3C77_793740 [compost metagenome]
MGIDEAGHQHLAAQVEQPGAGLLEFSDLGIGADGQDPAVLDRDRLLQGLARLGGVDLGVVKNQVDGGHSFQGRKGQ